MRGAARGLRRGRLRGGQRLRIRPPVMAAPGAPGGPVLRGEAWLSPRPRLLPERRGWGLGGGGGGPAGLRTPAVAGGGREAERESAALPAGRSGGTRRRGSRGAGRVPGRAPLLPAQPGSPRLEMGETRRTPDGEGPTPARRHSDLAVGEVSSGPREAASGTPRLGLRLPAALGAWPRAGTPGSGAWRGDGAARPAGRQRVRGDARGREAAVGLKG